MIERLQIESRPLRDAGPELPRVALGCGNFGGVGSAPEFFGQGLSSDEASAVMDAAWELGITHFDTADAYGGGRSERAIGSWMRSRGVRPMLTTKTFNPMAAGADHGLAPERIERQFGDSLERLGVDSVELYLAHDHDPDAPLAATFATFEELRTGGRIGAYGVSNFDAAQLERALAAGAPAAIQNGYSLLERDDEAEVLPLCAARGVAYLVYSPLRGGWLTGRYRRGKPYPAGSRMTQRPEPYADLATDRTFDALEAFERFTQARGTSMAGTALAWLLSDERIGQVVIGPGRVAHLEPVREALAAPLSDDERQHVHEIFA
ncbi:MAG TPA: aldo/keto reductase [Solirubrobacteraceae bacterium]|nr:aldo/keto reductase [Solirubrobacteraceae bacterium]